MFDRNDPRAKAVRLCSDGVARMMGGVVRFMYDFFEVVTCDPYYNARLKDAR